MEKILGLTHFLTKIPSRSRMSTVNPEQLAVSEVETSVKKNKKKSKINEEHLSLPVGCKSVYDFLYEYEKDISYDSSPFSLFKYHCYESYILQKLIMKLKQEKHEEFSFRGESYLHHQNGPILENGENRVIFEDLALFHVVCLTKQAFLVEKYLNEGAKVNEAVDATRDGEYAGSSPLHLALSELQFTEDHDEQFSVVLVLLKYGADVNSRNKRGDSPLHVLLSHGGPIDQLLFNIIKNNGADVNATNKKGETPFETLLATHASVDVDSYIKNGGSINHFNSINKKGCIAMMMMTYRVPTETITSSPNIMQVDDQGRTSLHNVVSFEPNSKDANYIEFLYHKLPSFTESLLSMGCNIDCQDNLGQTPLHYTVNFHNRQSVTLLLRLGPDVNVVDAVGKSALALSLDFSKLIANDHQKKQNGDVMNTLMVHMRNLKLQGCRISKSNKKKLKKARKINCVEEKSNSRY